MRHEETFQPDTDVIVVGNGPAGIALSAFLSGREPIYDRNKPHPDPLIHENLSDSLTGLLYRRDIESWYAQDYEQRNPIVGLYSDFYDRLMRPSPTNTDSFSPQSSTCLQYLCCRQRMFSHIVLGDSAVGGSWNNYDDNMETVSLSNWMDLPGYSLAQWLGGQPLLARLPAGIIREYMHAYVKKLGLSGNFMEHTTVTNIMKFCSDVNRKEYWRVQGYHASGERFELTCKRLVLACGRKRHKTLEVEGEMNAMNLVYNVRALKQLIQQQSDLNEAQLDQDLDFEINREPVVVVGDGISAADAITYCLDNEIPVLHVFRRSEKQLKSTMLSRLSSTIYPEYSRIFDLMLERTEHPFYKRAPSTVVSAIQPDSNVLLTHLNDKRQEKLQYRCLVICVGLQTELSMLEDKHDFSADYRSQQDPSLYAIGSVVGDHFIRYLIGGSFRVAQHLLQEKIRIRREPAPRQQLTQQQSHQNYDPALCRWRRRYHYLQFLLTQKTCTNLLRKCGNLVTHRTKDPKTNMGLDLDFDGDSDTDTYSDTDSSRSCVGSFSDTNSVSSLK